MGIIDDYYGGYENLALYTDSEGVVDFDAAYGTTYPFGSDCGSYDSEDLDAGASCGSEGSVGDDDDDEDPWLKPCANSAQLLRSRSCTANVSLENMSVSRSRNDPCNLHKLAPVKLMLALLTIDCVCADATIANKTTAELKDKHEWRVAHTVQVANDILKHEGYSRWEAYCEDSKDAAASCRCSTATTEQAAGR